MLFLSGVFVKTTSVSSLPAPLNTHSPTHKRDQKAITARVRNPEGRAEHGQSRNADHND